MLRDAQTRRIDARRTKLDEKVLICDRKLCGSQGRAKKKKKSKSREQENCEYMRRRSLTFSLRLVSVWNRRGKKLKRFFTESNIYSMSNVLQGAQSHAGGYNNSRSWEPTYAPWRKLWHLLRPTDQGEWNKCRSGCWLERTVRCSMFDAARQSFMSLSVQFFVEMGKN